MIFNRVSVLFAFATLLGATQCSTQTAPQIRGVVALAAGWKPVLYIVQPRHFKEIAASYSGVILDSASIGPDGRFAFPSVALPEGKTLLQICIQKTGGRFSNQLADADPLAANYMPLVVQQHERIDITASAAHFQANFLVQNASTDNIALMRLRDIRQQSFAQQRKRMQRDQADESTLLEQEEALHQFRLPLMAFADTCNLLLPALVAARWVSPEGDYERVPEFMVGQCERWQERLPGNPMVEELCQSGSREKLPVLTGDVIPDFALPMVTGDTSRLLTLLGSRLTIVDIWASWCMPCRRENREVLAPLWNRFHDNGLQILGYSIDSSPGAWKAAIAKDGANWPHASHLSGDATPFLDTLRITTIPANFVLNKKGEIIGKNLHGDALKAFIEDRLK